MDEMKSRIPDPDFIIITGDFMGHDFNEEFERYSGTYNKDSLDLFIKKTMRFVTHYIVKYFPDTFIIPMVGNDDADCGNYMITPEGDFLKMLSELWEPLVNKNAVNDSFQEDFSKGGYCILNFPQEESGKFKMIVLNTVFFSSNYINMCGDSLKDPGAEELEWLSKTLRKCKDDGVKVLMSYHIPPGIDIYGTIHGKGNCEEKIFPAWKKSYNDEFLKIITENSDVISSGFAGHFHRDDFRIYYANGKPVSYIHITPSISPIYGNNPSYQIFEYDRSDFALLNYTTYYLKNLTRPDSAYWTFEYDFKSVYEESPITAVSMNNVAGKVYSDSSYRYRYIDFYTSKNNKMTKEDIGTWYYNWCGFGNLTVEEYAACLCKDSLNFKK
jgi:hypothetical protein